MSKAAVIEASAARSNFAKLGSQARRAPVEVTRHGKIEFVVISPDLYAAVKAAGTVRGGELERMQASFDTMFQDMQSEQSNAAYDALEALTAEDLLQAATEAYNHVEKPAPARRSRPRIGR
jgi:PHD/YefM family antitoxin component YafN of YafNO toxin-antitoxin module